MNLHERAVALVKEYRRVEAELVEILRVIDDKRLYRQQGATSLFVYATKILGLSESIAWNFITVSRAIKRSPALKQAIENGDLSVSKARRITSVLTPENEVKWVESAKTLSQRSLEKAIAKENPRAATAERASYVAENFLKLEVGLTEDELKEIKRVQDLLCQSSQGCSSLKDAILEAIRFYKRHKDPMEKAKRARVAKPDSSQERGAKPGASQEQLEPKAHGRALPAALVHAVIRRDKSQCTGKNPDATRCENRRWLDIHHIVPKSRGGGDVLENLATLCRAHHQLYHRIAKVGGQIRQ